MSLNLFTLAIRTLQKYSNEIHNPIPRSQQHRISMFAPIQDLQINVLHSYIRLLYVWILLDARNHFYLVFNTLEQIWKND